MCRWHLLQGPDVPQDAVGTGLQPCEVKGGPLLGKGSDLEGVLGGFATPFTPFTFYVASEMALWPRT